MILSRSIHVSTNDRISIALCIAGKWAPWWWMGQIQAMSAILYISQTHTAISLLCQPPTCRFPSLSTPQAQRLLQTKLDRTKLYRVSAATCRQVWRAGSLFVPASAHAHAALPFFSVTISPSITSHWHCLSHEASNSFLSLHLFRNLWKHFLSPAPNTLHLCSIWVPKTNLKRSWWA